MHAIQLPGDPIPEQDMSQNQVKASQVAFKGSKNVDIPHQSATYSVSFWQDQIELDYSSPATFARYYNQFQTRNFAFCRPFEVESFPY